MTQRCSLHLLPLLLLLVSSAAACSDGGSPVAVVSDAGDDAQLDDPAPTFTEAEREALRSLRYDDHPPAIDVSNRVSELPAARLFGQRLFFDPSLSGPLIEGDNDGKPGSLGARGEGGKVSCAGCHIPSTSFVDTRSRGEQISLGALWSERKTPTLLESGHVSLFNWDGRRDSMWRQAIGVMESERELNAGRLFVAEQIFRLHRAEYEAVFGPLPPLDDARRFPQLTPVTTGCTERSTSTGVAYDCHGRPGDGAEYDGMTVEDRALVTRVTVDSAKAIAAYVRLLRCGPGRFDAWLDGDASALDRAEQRGAALFVGRARCVQCHGGPNLTDGAFHNVGLQPQRVAVAFVDKDDRGAIVGIAEALSDPLGVRGPYSDGDDGRLPATTSLTPALEGAFRTPSLRCVSTHPSFMHTAHLASTKDVIAFFDRGGDAPGGYPGKSELVPLGLDARERADLVAFLAALEGPGPPAILRVAPPPR